MIKQLLEHVFVISRGINVSAGADNTILDLD